MDLWLPISFQRKTIDAYKQLAARQNKARRKRLANTTECEDDVGLKGICQFINTHITIPFACIVASSVKRACKAQHSIAQHCQDSDSDFENKENKGMFYLLYVT